jgi:hypothetical protein
VMPESRRARRSSKQIENLYAAGHRPTLIATLQHHFPLIARPSLIT